MRWTPRRSALGAVAAAMAGDPRIDARRIGVLGFGAGAMSAALAAVPTKALLYPGCSAVREVPAAAGEILLLHGAADPANPTASCAAAAAALGRGGARVRRIEYRGAGYAWDQPGFMAGDRWLVPAPGGGRVAAVPWPALTALSAAQVAGFFAVAFAR